ncbi:hypothetical protein M5C72_02660 [Companilactobacillus allii]|uniref:DUF2829 domain-containing protein n=1 Tax=Companilactobacillus allii TaxID=1847728 RepID=A0A1P8Q2F4_9LACO|nr:hypothetical protein [Companilactobacillus allii]APX72064.1 hypothetical protein BTM29_05580 [Companilactobacillus allii]USQ69156.1 hypothetical protein M5C72_02660 [Companilactobacillus allii]
MEYEDTLKLIKNKASIEMRLPQWHAHTRIGVNRLNPSSPYLEVRSDNGVIPWIPTYPEMFSTNWQIY